MNQVEKDLMEVYVKVSATLLH